MNRKKTRARRPSSKSSSDELEEGLEDTFPASDPPTATQPVHHAAAEEALNVPLQNRVDPFGELIATPARGTCSAIAAGDFIATTRRSARAAGPRGNGSAACCRSRGAITTVWRDRYTALFFLDEVTAFAAGHRPCFECRRADAKAFAAKWARGERHAMFRARPRWICVLQAERLDGRAKRTHAMPIDDLPDGACCRCRTAPRPMRCAARICCAGATTATPRGSRARAAWRMSSRRRASSACSRPVIGRSGIPSADAI